MNIEKLYCVNLYTRRLAEMIAFYRDTLGIPAVFPGFSENGDGIKLGLGPDKFLICLWDDAKWGDGYCGKVEIALRADPDALHDELAARGYPVADVEAPPYGRLLTVLDPDGNRLAVMKAD